MTDIPKPPDGCESWLDFMLGQSGLVYRPTKKQPYGWMRIRDLCRAELAELRREQEAMKVKQRERVFLRQTCTDMAKQNQRK